MCIYIYIYIFIYIYKSVCLCDPESWNIFVAGVETLFSMILYINISDFICCVCCTKHYVHIYIYIFIYIYKSVCLCDPESWNIFVAGVETLFSMILYINISDFICCVCCTKHYVYIYIYLYIYINLCVCVTLNLEIYLLQALKRCFQWYYISTFQISFVVFVVPNIMCIYIYI